MAEIRTDWQIDSNILNLLDQAIDRANKTNAAFDSLTKSNPFDGVSSDVNRTNQSLTSLVSGYKKATDQVKGLSHEHKTLLAIQKDLVAKEKQFLANGKYDQYERELKSVRDRLKEINKNYDDAPGKLDKIKSAGNSVGNALKTAFTVTGVLFLISKIVEIGQKIIDVTGIGEKYGNQFTRIFNGNREAATAYLTILQDTADTTNFTFDQLADNASKLASRGIIPTQAEILKLGDAANFINKDITELNEAILDANEPERWKNLGFVVKTSGDQMTLSYGDFSKTVAKTTEGAYEAIQAFAEQKKVLGSTAEAGKTLSGRMSTLGDVFVSIFRTIGNGNNGALNDLIDLLTSIITTTVAVIRVVQPAFDKIGSAFGAVGGAIGSVVKAFGNFDRKSTETGTFAQKLGFYFSKFIIAPLTGVVLIAAGTIEALTAIVLAGQLAYAKLTNDKAGEAVAKQGLAEAEIRRKQIVIDFKKNYAEMQQTLGQFVAIEDKKAAEKKKKDEDALAQLEGELAGRKKKPKKDTPETDAEKKKREKAKQDENNLLLKAEEEYLKELEKLQTENRKNLKDQFDKDSISYLNAKKESDLQEIEQERLKFLELKQTKAGTTFKDPKTGKLDIKKNTNVTLDDKENALFQTRKDQVGINFDKDLSNIVIDQQIAEIELKKETDETIVQLERLKWEKRINEAQKGTVNYELLIEAKGRALAELEKSLFGKEATKRLIDLDREGSVAELQTFTDLAAQRRLGLISQKDFEKDIEDQRLVQQIDAAKKRLAILKEFGNQQNDEVKKQITQTAGEIEALLIEQLDNKESGLKGRSIYDLIFDASGSGKKKVDEFAEKAEFFKSIVGSVLDFELDLAKQRVDSLNTQIDAKRTQLDEELELQKQGLANNAGLRQSEIVKLEADRKQALQQAKVFQVAQQSIESIEQASSLVTAVANIFKVESKKGVLGLVLAGVGTALLLTLFKVFKGKAAQTATAPTTYGEGGELKGESHAQRGLGIRWGSTNIYSEGGEYIVKKRVAKQRMQLLKAINGETINRLDPLAVLKMINPEWVNNAGLSYDRALDMPKPETGIPADFWPMFMSFAATAGDYYTNAPRETAVPLAPGVVSYKSVGGERIERHAEYMNPKSND